MHVFMAFYELCLSLHAHITRQMTTALDFAVVGLLNEINVTAIGGPTVFHVRVITTGI